MIDIQQAYKKIKTKKKIERCYADPGTAYCFAVLRGEQLAGYWIQLACLRHIQDLAKTDDEKYPYRYDLTQCEVVLRFAGFCPEVETMRPAPLMPWQAFILCQLYGWRHLNGNKRFSQVNLSVARAQGKTYLCAIIACYSLLIECDHLSNQDLMVASNITQQASKLYGYVKTMMDHMLETSFSRVQSQRHIETQHNRVLERKNNNKLLQMSAESGKFDGFHFLTAIFDEAGETEHSAVTKKITSGQIDVANKQFIQISTAYPDTTVPFKKEQDVWRQSVEKGDGKADEQLCLVWCQDDKEEYKQPHLWEKSNPLLGLVDKRDQLLHGLLTERSLSELHGTEHSFLNKNLNLWLGANTGTSYVSSDDYKDTTVSQPFDLTNRDVYIGFDASLSSDNTALVFVFPYLKNNEERFYVRQHSFIPYKQLGSIQVKEQRDELPYQRLAEDGICTVTNDETGLVDLDQVYDWLIDFVDEHALTVRFFGYDVMRTKGMSRALEDNTTWPIMKIPQTSLELSEPIKFIQESFIRRIIEHDTDPILEKALLHAEIREQPRSGGLEVGKAKRTFKIDVVDALINAMYQAMYHFEGGKARSENPYDRLTTEEIEAMIRNGGMIF